MSQSANLSQTSPKTAPYNVYMILALGVVSISLAPVLVRLAQGEGISSIAIAASRLTLATLILTPIALSRYRENIRALTRRDLLLAFTSGVFLAMHFISWVTALEYTSVLLSTVFVTSAPIWVALLEFTFLKAQLSRFVVAGLVVAIAGGLLIGFSGESPDVGEIGSQSDLIGGVLSLVGAITVAVYLIIGRKLREKMPVVPYIWLVYGSAAIVVMCIVAATKSVLIGYSTEGYIWLVAMTIFPQLIGHSSFNYAIGYMPATLVGMTAQLEPIGSSILAFVLFSELPALLQIVGSAIILIGVTLANLGQTGKQKRDKLS